MSNYNPYTPYPSGYQPNYQQMQQQLQQLQQAQQMQPQYGQPKPQQQQVNMYAWVNGIEGAKAYLVPPNTSILLMDSDNKYLYVKVANEQGQASLKTYAINEVELTAEKPLEVDMSGYVKVDEFNKLKTQFENMLTKKEK